MINPCCHENAVLTLTPAGPHHGRLDCPDCGRFVKWVAKPETVERNKRTVQKIAALQTKSLSEWEKGFIESIKETPTKLSPKQLAKLDEVCERHKV